MSHPLCYTLRMMIKDRQAIQEQLADIAEAVSPLTIRAEQDAECEEQWNREGTGEDAGYWEFLHGKGKSW